jgi:inner membrane protein
MATILTHAVVGLGLARLFAQRPMHRRFWDLAVLLPMLPDLDVITFNLGIPYESPWGHRGFTHSLLFALITGIIVSSLTWRIFRVPWWDLTGFFFLLVASHGILDAFTNGGEGIEFFWPFSTERFFFPWHPIHVSPIGRAFFLQGRGWPVLWSEFLWVWIPTGVIVGCVELWRRFRRVP